MSPTQQTSWVESGVNPPAQDICQGWYLRNRASNVELSSLVPAAHLYAIMGPGEIEKLAEYFESGSTAPRPKIFVKQGEEEIPLSEDDSGRDEEEYRNRANVINQQIFKDVIDAEICKRYVWWSRN